jgi:hypothetical protein
VSNLSAFEEAAEEEEDKDDSDGDAGCEQQGGRVHHIHDYFNNGV